MSAMAKDRGEQWPGLPISQLQSRRKRSVPPEANQTFVRAFADALRDILRHERRRAA